MNAYTGEATRLPRPRRPRRRSADEAPASTSIRVSVETRDSLQAQARDLGLSLNRYLDEVARKADRERIFAEYRASFLEACKDPEFVAELLEWDEMDDGIEFDDDEYPEYNQVPADVMPTDEKQTV